MGFVKDVIAPNEPIIPTYAFSVFCSSSSEVSRWVFRAGHVKNRGR